MLCMHSYKRFQDEDPDLWRIVSKKSGIYNRLIGFLSNLLLRIDTGLPAIASGADRLASLDRETMMFPLTYQERNMLYWWDSDLKAIAVLDKALEIFDESKMDYFNPGDMVKSMLGWRDPQAQSSLFKTLLEGIVTLDPPFCDAYMRASLSYCEGCPVVDSVNKIITTIAKAVASNSRIEEGRAPGGSAALDFFGGHREKPHLGTPFTLTQAGRRTARCTDACLRALQDLRGMACGSGTIQMENTP